MTTMTPVIDHPLSRFLVNYGSPLGSSCGVTDELVLVPPAVPVPIQPASPERARGLEEMTLKEAQRVGQGLKGEVSPVREHHLHSI